MSRTIRRYNNLPKWLFEETRHIDNVIKGYSDGNQYGWYMPYDADKELYHLNSSIAYYTRDGEFGLKQRQSNTHFSGNPWDEVGKSIGTKRMVRRAWSKSNRRCAKDDVSDGLEYYYDNGDDGFRSLKTEFDGFNDSSDIDYDSDDSVDFDGFKAAA